MIKKIIYGFIFLICVILIAIFPFIAKESEVNVVGETPIIEEKKEEIKEEVKEVKVLKKYVDIKGAVKKPGVYEINENDRVINLIKKAGGLLKDANTDTINLSKLLKDEMRIIIYTNEEVENFKKPKEEKEESKYEQIKEEIICEVENDACDNENKTEDTTDDAKLVNINEASKEELMSISGIGESKAISIIEYRVKTPFKSIEDIKNVSGIGNALYEKIKDFITV